MMMIDSNLSLLESRLAELQKEHQQRQRRSSSISPHTSFTVEPKSHTEASKPQSSRSDRINWHISFAKSIIEKSAIDESSSSSSPSLSSTVNLIPFKPEMEDIDSSKDETLARRSERTEHDELAEGLVRMAQILKRNNLAMQKLIQKDQTVP